MSLVGRDSELDTLLARLQARRLVTVIGPGGIGKTRLARAAVAAVAERYELGAHFVDLTRVSGPDEVADAVAAALGHPSFDALLDTPTDKSALVVVDNCEHVVAAAATAVGRLLEACLAPTVLATSRTPLDLPGEAVVSVGPLELPPPGLIDADAAAVRMFRERAHDAGVTLTRADLEVVCEMCRRLDGVPLGIELAAARTRSLAPAEILAHFDRQLDVVARPGRRMPDRHRSLRDTIAWSRALLDEPDRRFLDRLSVFAGPFTSEQAHAVAADPGSNLVTTLDHLDRLVGTSLLLTETDGATTRYRLLESVRAFADEALRDRGEHEVAMDRFVAHAVDAAKDMLDTRDHLWRASPVAEGVGLLDNLIAATRWCLHRDETPERGIRLVAAMWGLMHQSSNAELAEVGDAVLQRWPDPAVRLWPDAAATVATARHLLGQHERAARLAERALAAPGDSTLAPATLRRVLGLVARADGEAEAALRLLRDAAGQARRRGARALAIELDVLAAEVAADVAGAAEALERLRASSREAGEQGFAVLEVLARTIEGHLLLRMDPAAATDVVGSAVRSARELGFRPVVSLGLCGLACDRLMRDDAAGAAVVTLELFDEIARAGVVGLVRTGLEVAASVLHQLGNPVWADVAATAATIPPRGGLSRELPEALRPAAGKGRVLLVREAFDLARSEMRSSTAPGPSKQIEVGEASRPTFRRTGDMWEIDYARRTVHLKHTKGMDDLARLLAQPGREIHCLDLAGAAVTETDTGEVIDTDARRAYEDRILELQSDLEEAEAGNDVARAERARIELDDLVDHLAAATGLGSRTRRGGTTVERARSAVTQRIRSTVKRIAVAHPRLGRHLDVAIRTGTYCSYHPEEHIDWQTEAV